MELSAGAYRIAQRYAIGPYTTVTSQEEVPGDSIRITGFYCELRSFSCAERRKSSQLSQ
jgi:hypothetical protein